MQPNNILVSNDGNGSFEVEAYILTGRRSSLTYFILFFINTSHGMQGAVMQDAVLEMYRDENCNFWKMTHFSKFSVVHQLFVNLFLWFVCFVCVF